MEGNDEHTHRRTDTLTHANIHTLSLKFKSQSRSQSQAQIQSLSLTHSSLNTPTKTRPNTRHRFPRVVLTSLVQGPFTSSGLTTLCQRCWHWTSFLSGKPAAITSHFSPCCSTSPLSFYSRGAAEGEVQRREEGWEEEKKELDTSNWRIDYVISIALFCYYKLRYNDVFNKVVCIETKIIRIITINTILRPSPYPNLCLFTSLNKYVLYIYVQHTVCTAYT